MKDSRDSKAIYLNFTLLGKATFLMYRVHGICMTFFSHIPGKPF